MQRDNSAPGVWVAPVLMLDGAIYWGLVFKTEAAAKAACRQFERDLDEYWRQMQK